MSDQIPWDLLERYLAGDITPAERAEALTYLAAHPAEEAVLRRLMANVTQPSYEAPDVSAWWSAMQQRIDQTQHVHGQRSESGKRQRPNATQSLWRRRSPWAPIAAIALGVMIFVVGWKVSARFGVRSESPGPSYTTYTTAPGQRATVTLPDGNSVVLNVASRLDVPINYGSGNHVVRLFNGEALFTITHHTGVPFTVVTDRSTTRVLGTSFIVRHYPSDTTVLVAVREGRVVVGTTVLNASQMVEVARTGVTQVRVSDGTPFLFTTGVLQLNGVPLPVAIAELDRWYDVDIRLGSVTLATQRMKGEFATGSLADLTDILEYTLGVRVVRNGRVLTLLPR